MVVEKGHHFITLSIFPHPLYTLRFLSPYITLPLALFAGNICQGLGQESQIWSCFETILLVEVYYHV